MKMDKWTQQLHDKLAEREVAPPDDLWADIEAALPKDLAGSKKPRARFVPLRRWAVAATLALLVAGGGYRLWHSSNPEAPTSIPQTPQTPQPELSQTDPKVLTESQENHGDWLNDSSAAEIRVPVPVIRPSTNLMAQASVEKSIIETHETTENSYIPQAENAPQQSNHNSQLSTLNSPLSNDDPLHQIDEAIAQLSSKSDKSMTLGLYASNGFTHLQRSNGVRMDDALAARYEIDQYLPHNRALTRSDEPIYLVGYEERQKHYLPIAIGLSVSYPLSTKWSLSSGIIYTRLHSDFASIINGSAISQEQILHYLGIPLNAQYQLFHRGGLNIYLSAGAEADYNIKTYLASEGVTQHLNRDRLQFSVQGGVGLQYNILPQFGLYAEPGVKHYFDNGSRLRNYFKDQPTSFNLQLGLRLNLKK
jgi:hypothetical protein